MTRNIFHIPKVTAPEGFTERVMDRIARKTEIATLPSVARNDTRRILRTHLPLAMAAVALLAFGLGLVSSLLLTTRGHRGDTVMVRFSLYAPEAAAVSIAGDFNDWRSEGGSLAPQGHGVWSVTIPLAPGRYKYLFLVNGKTWVPDPESSRYSDDGFGGKNSVLDIS